MLTRTQLWIFVLPLVLIAMFSMVLRILPITADEATVLYFKGEVVAVKDGDSIEVLRNGKAVRIRLAHIDCPEGGQAFGRAAKQFTSDFCYRRMVDVHVEGKPDRYGRLICTIEVDGANLNKALVEAGLAWHYKQYSNDSAYAVLEEAARLSRIGLWEDPHAVAPWTYRKNARKAREAN